MPIVFFDNQYAVNMGATYDKYGVSHFELFKNTDGLSNNPYTLPTTEDLVNQKLTLQDNLKSQKSILNDKKSVEATAQQASDNADIALNQANEKVITAQQDLNNTTTANSNAEVAKLNANKDLSYSQDQSRTCSKCC